MWFFKQKSKYGEPTQEAREESARVKGLKKEVRQLTELLTIKEERIEQLHSELQDYYKNKDSNQWLPLIEKVLSGGMTPSANPQQPLSMDLSDDNIREMVKQMPKNQIKTYLSLGDKQAKATLKAKAPHLTEHTLNRCIEIAKEVIR